MTTVTNEKPQFAFTDSYRGTFINIIASKAFKKKGQEKGDPKFSGLFIIEPKFIDKDGKQVIDPASDFGRLQAEIVRMLKAKFPGKKLVIGRRMTQEELDSGSAIEVLVPWQKGDALVKKSDEKYKEENARLFTGKYVVKASSKYRPAIDAVEPGTGKLLQYTNADEAVIKSEGAKFFYSGAWFLPTFVLNFYQGDDDNPSGVSLYLQSILFCRHGDRIGGKKHNPAEAYKGYLGKISAEDPTGEPIAEELADEETY